MGRKPRPKKNQLQKKVSKTCDIKVYNLRNRTVYVKSLNTVKKPKNKTVKDFNTLFHYETPKRSNRKMQPRKIMDQDSGFIDEEFEEISHSCSLHNNNINCSSVQLSTYHEKWNWKKKLQWIQQKRDIGLYIQCCHDNCKKWRYVERYHDPVEVPEVWYCSDLDKNTSCSMPVEEPRTPIRNDLLEIQYTAGSLVWAKCPGYPWWPAMVCDSRDTLSYYILSQKSAEKPIMYHVVYFTDNSFPVTSWLYRRSLKPFLTTPRAIVSKKMTYYGKNYTEEVEHAHNIANSIVREKLTISERLTQYSYLAQLGGYTPSNYDASQKQSTGKKNLSRDKNFKKSFISSDSEDEIPGTPLPVPRRVSRLQTHKSKQDGFHYLFD